jgi:protein tyrosine/serine phosphatase
MTNWIDLDGAHNVRDLGGLPAAGGWSQPGVLLRSDALDACTSGDVDHLVDSVGLAHVIDLRTKAERTERGRGLLGDSKVRYTELSLIDEGQAAQRNTNRTEAFVAGQDPSRIMADSYVQLLEMSAGSFVTALERIVAPGGTPVLVHCAAGKDRTGVMIALLLDAAGVDRGAIVADYADTHERMALVVARLRAARDFQKVAAEIPAFVMEARPATMELFLQDLDDRWKGASNFLIESGASEATLESWRSLFVDSAG